MNSRRITNFKVVLAAIGLWLIFTLQGTNVDNVYFLFYLPLLFVAYIVLKSPLSNEKLLNKYVSYVFAFLLSAVTVWKIAIDSEITVGWVFAVKAVLCILGLTFLFEKLFQLIIQFSLNHTLTGKSIGISWKASFGLILLGWLVYLIPFLPGNIAGDANFQLSQFFGDAPMTNHHPYFSTLFEGGLFRIGRSLVNDNFGLFLYVLIQLLLCALIYSFCISKVSKLGAGINKKIAVIFSLFIGFTPYWSFASETLHKDGMFLAFFALYVTLLLLTVNRFFITKTEQPSAKEFVGLAFAGLLVCFWRNDGIYMVVPALICLIFVEKRKYWKQFLMTLAAVLLIYVGFNKVALPALHVAPTEKREALSLPVQQTARYMKYYPHDITKSERQVLAQTFIKPSEIGKVYNPNISDPVKFSLKGHVNTKAYLKMWFAMGLRHPLVYFNATFAGTDEYYVPWEKAPNFSWAGDMSSWSRPKFLHTHYYVPAQIRLNFTKLVNKISDFPLINILFSFSMAFWLCLLMVAYLWRGYGFKYVVPYIPIFMNLLVCIASPVNGMTRYAGCVVFATFMLIGYYFFVIMNKKG